jgi:hypothetical protein
MARPRSVDKTGKHPGSKQIALRLTVPQYEKLRRRAERQGCTVSELVRRTVLESSAA